MTRHDARLLDFCSLVLERRGAQPVSRAPPDLQLSPGYGVKPRCVSCRHPLNEHGADGECWFIDDDGVRQCWCGAVNGDEPPPGWRPLPLERSALPVCCRVADWYPGIITSGLRDL